MDGGSNLDSVDEMCYVIGQGGNGSLSCRSRSRRKGRLAVSTLGVKKDVELALKEEWNDIVPQGQVGQERIGEHNPWCIR